ncbi:MAG TPA: RNA polymerase sigma factor [Gemmatimonadaceae bacterium]|nr:RNA polymerase sigma factor [Gemmatimonadaceae bacterium]
MIPDNDSDDTLIARLLDRDSLAFDALYSRHTGTMYATAMRIAGDNELASDAVHDAWVRAVEGLSQFERRSSLRTWLTAILINCIRERWREGRGEVPLDLVSETTLSILVNTTTVDPVDLERAIAELPPGFRQVLVLHDVEGFHHGEIATMLGIAAGTSKSQLARARHRMRELLTSGTRRRAGL